MLIQYTSQPILSFADYEDISPKENIVVEDFSKDDIAFKGFEENLKENIIPLSEVSSENNKKEIIIPLGPDATATLRGENLELTGVFNGNITKVPEEYENIKPLVKKINIKNNFKIIGKASYPNNDPKKAPIGIFINFRNLISIDNIELLDTSEMTEMARMFMNCESLTELKLDNFDTSNAMNMNLMFHNCSSLDILDLQSFNTSNVRDMSAMFSQCISLKSINLSKFDTSKVNMMPLMFQECSNLKKIDLSNFDTSNVIGMGNMFENCWKLEELDLSSFDTSSSAGNNFIFKDSRNLDKIKLGNKTKIINHNNSKPLLDFKDYPPYTGRWRVEEYPDISFIDSKDFIENYSVEYPGTYYREKAYILSFNTLGGSMIEDRQIIENEKAIKPEGPIKDGYELEGWYTDEALTNKYDFDNLVNKDFTLYAKWEKKETPVEPVERLSDTVVLASGYKYTDVLTATVLANEKHAPILLSEVDSLTDDTMTEIKRINPTEIIISGGENSVSQKIENLLKSEFKDISITRVSGKDRYETAKNIGVKVREISPNKTEAMLVDGTNFPDVITMSTIASEKRAPILLTEPNILNETTKTTLNEFNIKDIIIGGGFDSVSENIEKNLKTNISTIRYGGTDRYETASIVGNAYRTLAGVSNNLIVVDGTNFPDGITTSSLASKIKAPILLTKPNSLPEITAKDINTWKTTNTIIAGGENSVSANIFNKVNGSERISGKDRYETAVKISQKYLEDK